MCVHGAEGGENRLGSGERCPGKPAQTCSPVHSGAVGQLLHRLYRGGFPDHRLDGPTELPRELAEKIAERCDEPGGHGARTFGQENVAQLCGMIAMTGEDHLMDAGPAQPE